MSSRLSVLLINPPSHSLEKVDYGVTGTVFDFNIPAMNPGLLSLATYLNSIGHDVEIIDLSPDADFNRLRTKLQETNPRIVGVSAGSGWCYLEALHAAELSRQEVPDALIIGGGQHLGPVGQKAFNDCAALDVVCKYEGEWVLREIVERMKAAGGRRPALEGIPGIVYRNSDGSIQHGENKSPPLLDLNDMPLVRFDLYPGYKNFTPFVEESRGCPYPCAFCAATYASTAVKESKQKSIRYKSPERMLREFDHAIEHFGKDVFYAILASSFGLRAEWMQEFLRGMKERGVSWGTELRTDGPWEKYIELLPAAGGRELVIGLESASIEILKRIEKTPNPVRYLERASAYFARATEVGLYPGMNYVTYMGETPATLKESLQWFLDNRRNIYRFNAYTLFIFEGSKLAATFDRDAPKFGAERIVTNYAKRTHVYPVRISKHFSYEESAYWCSVLMKTLSADTLNQLGTDRYDYGRYDFYMDGETPEAGGGSSVLVES